MFRFKKEKDDIFIGEVSLKEAAKNHLTPFYLYDLDGLKFLLKDIKIFTQKNPHIQVCYAVKANWEPKICKLMIETGLGFDVVSAGEITHLRKLGASAKNLHFSGVGKPIHEIDLAIEEQIGGFNIESLDDYKMSEKADT